MKQTNWATSSWTPLAKIYFASPKESQFSIFDTWLSSTQSMVSEPKRHFHSRPPSVTKVYDRGLFFAPAPSGFCVCLPRFLQGIGHERNDVGTPHTTDNRNSNTNMRKTNHHKLTNVEQDRIGISSKRWLEPTRVRDVEPYRSDYKIQVSSGDSSNPQHTDNYRGFVGQPSRLHEGCRRILRNFIIEEQADRILKAFASVATTD